MEYDKYCEYIVVGIGGIGSGALYWLAKRAGKDVLGLEQFKLGHHNGGSQDHSRIIRHAYAHDKYTRLTAEQFKAWREVGAESGLRLAHIAGSLDLAHRDAARASKVTLAHRAMRRQGIPAELLTGAEIRARFPQWTVGDDVIGVFVPEGGFVDAALANSTHIQLARGYGATVLEECPVLKLQPTADRQVIVHTPKGKFKCRRLVVSAGAWVNHVLGSVGVHIPVKVSQEQVTYFATPNIRDFTEKNFVGGWIFQHGDKSFYGMAIHGNSCTKIGIDSDGPQVTPETRTFDPDPIRERQCVEFFKKYLPKALGPIHYTKTCLYAMTYDRDFVIDTLACRGLPQVIVCCGAGHAFKWASFLGKVLSELAIDGGTKHPIADFNFDRPAVTDPNYKPNFYYGIEPGAKL